MAELPARRAQVKVRPRCRQIGKFRVRRDDGGSAGTPCTTQKDSTAMPMVVMQVSMEALPEDGVCLAARPEVASLRSPPTRSRRVFVGRWKPAGEEPRFRVHPPADHFPPGCWENETPPRRRTPRCPRRRPKWAIFCLNVEASTT